MLAAVFMTSGTTSRTAFVSLSYALILCTHVRTSQFAFLKARAKDLPAPTDQLKLNRTFISHVITLYVMAFINAITA